MKYIPPKFSKLSEMASIDVGRLTEDEARAILEGIRWPKGPACPHCGSIKVTRIQAKSEKVRDGVIQCNDCHGQFTVTVGTVMHRSHITLRQWVQAFYSMCSHKKGVSALQLQRNLGLHCYKSAWHLAHRIRAAMNEGPLAGKLNGIVECDETYVGGKPRQGGRGGHIDHRRKGKGGRCAMKTPVMVLVERGGEAVSKPIERVDGDTLKSAIREIVDNKSTIMTDDLNCYRGIGREFAGGHQFVNHSTGEYARGNVTTNTAESYFSLLKRGIEGVFHHVSKQHLNRYCDEFEFRWNHRKVNDGTRAEHAILGAEGKRLTYKKAVC
ncbi:MAG: IS1595 family transposase [Sedimentisphaerales bacterium]|jgi:transposase-like protein